MDVEEVADLSQAKAQSSGGGRISKKDRRKAKKKGALSQADAVVEMLEASAIDGDAWTKVQGSKKKQKAAQRMREQMPLNDVLFCERMIGKHGEDYEAMARDPDNLHQLTAPRLRHKIDIFPKGPLILLLLMAAAAFSPVGAQGVRPARSANAPSGRRRSDLQTPEL